MGCMTQEEARSLIEEWARDPYTPSVEERVSYMMVHWWAGTLTKYRYARPHIRDMLVDILRKSGQL